MESDFKCVIPHLVHLAEVRIFFEGFKWVEAETDLNENIEVERPEIRRIRRLDPALGDFVDEDPMDDTHDRPSPKV